MSISETDDNILKDNDKDESNDIVDKKAGKSKTRGKSISVNRNHKSLNKNPFSKPLNKNKSPSTSPRPSSPRDNTKIYKYGKEFNRANIQPLSSSHKNKKTPTKYVGKISPINSKTATSVQKSLTNEINSSKIINNTEDNTFSDKVIKKEEKVTNDKEEKIIKDKKEEKFVNDKKEENINDKKEEISFPKIEEKTYEPEINEPEKSIAILPNDIRNSSKTDISKKVVEIQKDEFPSVPANVKSSRVSKITNLNVSKLSPKRNYNFLDIEGKEISNENKVHNIVLEKSKSSVIPIPPISKNVLKVSPSRVKPLSPGETESNNINKLQISPPTLLPPTLNNNINYSKNISGSRLRSPKILNLRPLSPRDATSKKELLRSSGNSFISDIKLPEQFKSSANNSPVRIDSAPRFPPIQKRDLSRDRRMSNNYRKSVILELENSVEELKKPLKKKVRKVKKVKRKRKKKKTATVPRTLKYNPPPLDYAYKNHPDYDNMNLEDQKFYEEDLRSNYKKLKQDYPEFDITYPENCSLHVVHAKYDRYLKSIEVEKDTEIYGFGLTILFGGIELFLTTMGINATGYAVNQYRMIRWYKKYLREMGEESFVTGTKIGSDWPVTAKIILLALTNAIIFVLINLVSKFLGDDTKDQIQNFINGYLVGENKQPPVYDEKTGIQKPPEKDNFDIGNILGNLGGLGQMLNIATGMNGGNKKSKPRGGRRANRKPKYND